MLVHGRVRRAGAAIEGFDLVFEPLDRPLGSPGDWDFTDDEGRYEVEVPPGSYAVRRDDDGAWVRDALVPAGLEELELDIDLDRR